MFVVDESKIVNGTYKGVMQVFSYDNANEIELPWSGQFLVLLRNQFGALPVVDYFEGNRYKLNEAIYHYRGSNVLEFVKVGGTRKTMLLVPLSVQVSAYNMENDGIKGAYIPELEKEIQKVLEVIRNSGTNVTNKEKAFLNNLKFIEKELTDKTNVVFGKVEEALNEVALVEQESERFLSLVRENERLVDEKYHKFDTDITEANQTIDDILALQPQFQAVLDETTGKDVISAPEIILARNGEANLKARLDKEQQQVTAQLAQTAANLKTFGAVGDGVADDTVIIENLINNYDNIFVPEGVFICSPLTFENLSHKNIFGVGTIKLKNSSTRSGMFYFKNSQHIKIEGITLDGNRNNVSFLNVGGWDDLVTLEDCSNCVILSNHFKNGRSLGLSVMNSSQDNLIEQNIFFNFQYSGVQVHGGIRSKTGEYTDNKMPLNNVVRQNIIEQCGEGIRASGTIGTEITNNKIINLNSNTGATIHIYTATHPGYDLAMGTKRIVVSGNYIRTSLSGYKRHIEVKNNQNEDGSGNHMEGIVIENNLIELLDNSVPIYLSGYNTPNLRLRHVTVRNNTIDATNVILGVDENYSSAIVLYRYVEHVHITQNRIKGKFRRIFDLVPQAQNVTQDYIHIQDNEIDESTEQVLIVSAVTGISINSLVFERNIVHDCSTISTYPIQLGFVYGLIFDSNTLKSTRSLDRIVLTGTTGERHVYQNNDFSGLAGIGAGIQNSLSDTKIYNNKGYVTENKGTVTFSAGTNVQIVHGLSRTPTRIIVTPKKPLGLAKYYYVDTVSGSVFKINIDTPPGQEVEFDWYCSYS